MTGEDFNNELENSGATQKENQDRKYLYAFFESRAGKDLDFWSSSLIDRMYYEGIEEGDIYESSFFIFSGNSKAYNPQDAGNFLWGAAMQKLGFSPGIPQLGAHIHHHFIQRISEGARGLFDSRADQQAITTGFTYGFLKTLLQNK